jgi:integrase
MRSPYTLYKEKTKIGPVWYARFWDENTKKYTASRSLGILIEGKRGRRREAEDKARLLVAIVQEEFRSQTPVKKTRDIPLIPYVLDFWTQNSPYVKECAVVKKKPLSAKYVQIHHDDTRLHIATYPAFKTLTVGELTVGHVRDWMRWCAERGLSGGRINKVMEAIRGAVVDAFKREEIERNPFAHIEKATDIRRERGVLVEEEIQRIIAYSSNDPRGHLGILLALLCSMRLGEVRGLLWGDVGKDGLIHISHNFIDEDGIKTPKCESARSVPYTNPIRAVLETVRQITIKTAPDDFVFPSLDSEGKPLGKGFFEKALKRELEAIGIPGKWHGKDAAPESYVNEQQKRNLTFHGLRHTFVTHGRLAGISDLEIQALAGHKSGAMMAHYSHANQVLDFQALKEKMERPYLPKVAGGNE